MRVYGLVGGETPEELAELAAAQVAKGMTAVKLNPCGRLEPLATPAAINAIVDGISAVREAIGPERDLALDFLEVGSWCLNFMIGEHLAPLEGDQLARLTRLVQGRRARGQNQCRQCGERSARKSASARVAAPGRWARMCPARTSVLGAVPPR